MKIKKTVEMKFWELLKHIEDNNIKNGVFKTKNDSPLYLWNGVLDLGNYKYVGMGKRFEVEIEEDITEDTEFENLKWVYLNTRDNDVIVNGRQNTSIKQILKTENRNFREVLTIYSCDKNGILTLIWTKEKGIIND